MRERERHLAGGEGKSTNYSIRPRLPLTLTPTCLPFRHSRRNSPEARSNQANTDSLVIRSSSQQLKSQIHNYHRITATVILSKSGRPFLETSSKACKCIPPDSRTSTRCLCPGSTQPRRSRCSDARCSGIMVDPSVHSIIPLGEPRRRE